MGRSAHGFGRGRVVDQVLGQAQGHDVSWDGRRVRPNAFELVARIGDEVGAADVGAVGSSGWNVAAIFVLNGRPRGPTKVAQERRHVALQLLAGEDASVGVGGGETIGPIRAPENEISSRLGFYADGACSGVTAVIDQVTGKSAWARSVGLSWRPEKMLRVG